MSHSAARDKSVAEVFFVLTARNLLRAINICIRPHFDVNSHTTVLFATMQIMFLFLSDFFLFNFGVFVCMYVAI